MNGAITTFGSVLQQAFGFDIYQVTLYQIPTNAISTFWFLLVGITSTKWRGLRFWWMIVSTVVVFIVVSQSPGSNSVNSWHSGQS